MTSVLHVTYMQLLKAHSTPACGARFLIKLEKWGSL
jgi:hypothetical protein